MNERDGEGLHALLAPGFEVTDRRSVVAGPSGDREFFIAAVLDAREMFDAFATDGVVATRGDRLVLSRCRWVRDGFDVRFLELAETDGHGLVAAVVMFDEDDLGGAVAELDASLRRRRGRRPRARDPVGERLRAIDGVARRRGDARARPSRCPVHGPSPPRVRVDGVRRRGGHPHGPRRTARRGHVVLRGPHRAGRHDDGLVRLGRNRTRRRRRALRRPVGHSLGGGHDARHRLVRPRRHRCRPRPVRRAERDRSAHARNRERQRPPRSPVRPSDDRAPLRRPTGALPPRPRQRVAAPPRRTT